MKKIFKLSLATVLCLTQCVQHSIAAKGGQNLKDKPQAEHALSTDISSRAESDFLGNPEFIIKNSENLSNCVSWEAFYAQYRENLSSLQKDYAVAAGPLYVLPHYNDGSCQWHALGISVSDTYDLIIESAKQILGERKAVEPLVTELKNMQKTIIDRKGEHPTYIKAIQEGIEGNTLQNLFGDLIVETEEEVRDRKEKERRIDEVEQDLEETFNALFPKVVGRNDLERFNAVKNLLDNKEQEKQNKREWMDLAKKYGGKAFTVNGVENAVRPLHNKFFFQKAADHLGVAINIFYEEVERSYFPSGHRRSSSIPTLYLQGTDGHYEPVVKQDAPVSLALIRDMENFLKRSHTNRLKVTQEDCIVFPVKSEKNPDKDLAARRKQEEADAELVAKLEQEEADAELAAKLEQEEADAEVARQLSKEYEQK